MSGPTEDGWAALARGDYAAAARCFDAAIADQPTAATYEGAAWAAWWRGDQDGLFAARGQAYTRYRDAGDDVAAARVAIWLGSDHYEFRGEDAVGRGWHQRARRLLADHPLTTEHGWLAFQEGAYALELHEDTALARERAIETAAIAEAIGASDLQFLALALEGLARVTEGDVTDGMRRLDEAGVAAVAGEMDRVAITWTLCYLIYACERVRDLGRAAQWCAEMERASQRLVLDLGLGICRAHYGAVLTYHGHWRRAESTLTNAARLMGRLRPLAMAQIDARLGELRRRQGRWDEAAVLFESAQPHPLAVLGAAALALEQGDARHAVELVEDLLEATPRAAVTQQADALELLARARAALGDVDGAAAAAAALAEIARTLGTRPLLAMAACAEAAAALAAGDAGHARARLGDAVALFEDGGLPYEAAITRVDHARALAALGRSQAAARQATAAAGRLRELGAHRAAAEAETVIEGSGAARDGARPLTAREQEVLAEVAQGHSDREIAQRLSISAHTVHRHVSNILTKLGLSSRAAAAAYAGRHGLDGGSREHVRAER